MPTLIPEAKRLRLLRDVLKFKPGVSVQSAEIVDLGLKL
jgi:hypothetical protein